MDTGQGSATAEPDGLAGRFDPDDAASIAMARARILARVEHACRRVGRSPDEVRLVGVSKTVEPERLRAAVAGGVTTLGENRVQEAESKVALVPGATWHLVGPLQSNKARKAVAIFGMIESVSSVELAERLDRIAGELRDGEALPVLLQVNVDGDPAKSGFSPDDLAGSLPAILALPHLRVDGLMTVGRMAADPEGARPTFVALRRIAEGARRAHDSVGAELSMGMSDDFEVAVEEGATIIRIGRALFGARPSGAV